MKTLLLALVTGFTSVAFSQADCACFSVRGAQLVGADSLELIFHNTCSNEVYMNVYLIRNVAPFDTIARYDGFGGHFVPINTDISYIIHTDLTQTPEFGSYSVTITNGNILCENIEQYQVASLLPVSEAQSFLVNSPVADWIELPGFIVREELVLYNSVGQRLELVINDAKISMLGLEKGIYFLTYRDKSFKFVKD